MSYYIQFGRVEKKFKSPAVLPEKAFIPMKGKIKGLCKEEFTIWPNDPIREPSNLGWYEFSNLYLRGNLCPNVHDGYVFRLVDFKAELKHISLNFVQELMKPIDLDRAKWLLTWSTVAFAKYGDKAVLKFT